MAITQKQGKAATKGQKQIHQENKSTIRFYTLMSSSTLLANVILSILIWPNSLTLGYFILTFFSLLVYVACLVCMKWMATGKFNEKGVLVDGGIDLNMESGFSEYIKDLIILTSACQILALCSIYFWNLWLLVPVRAFYLFWVNIAAPWFFAPAPEESEEETDEKKKRKLIRKQQRMRG